MDILLAIHHPILHLSWKKTEMDIVNYTENNQMDPTAVYYGRSSYQHDSHLNNSLEKINRAGKRQGYKNKIRSTNKKKLKSARPNR